MSIIPKICYIILNVIALYVNAFKSPCVSSVCMCVAVTHSFSPFYNSSLDDWTTINVYIALLSTI